MTYGKQENVKKELEKIKDCTDTELFTKLLEFYGKKEINKERMENCKSDAAYWGIISDDEENDEIIKHLEEKLISLLMFKSPNFEKMFTKLYKIENTLERKEIVLNDLKTYNPKQYKFIKNIIDNIFRDFYKQII